MKNLVNFIKNRSWAERIVLSIAFIGIGGITVWMSYYSGFVAHDPSMLIPQFMKHIL